MTVNPQLYCDESVVVQHNGLGGVGIHWTLNCHLLSAYLEGREGRRAGLGHADPLHRCTGAGAGMVEEIVDNIVWVNLRVSEDNLVSTSVGGEEILQGIPKNRKMKLLTRKNRMLLHTMRRRWRSCRMQCPLQQVVWDQFRRSDARWSQLCNEKRILVKRDNYA